MKNVPISLNQQKKLQRYENQIISLSKKNHSLAKRKQILKGGAFLQTLLNTTLPPIIDQLISKAKEQQQQQ